MGEPMKKYSFGLGILVFGGGLMFGMMGGQVSAQMVQKPSRESKVQKSEPEKKKPAESVTYGFMFPLDPFIINLAGSGGNRFMKVTVSLKMSAPEVHLELKKHILKLTDSILLLLSSKSFEDINSFQKKLKLEEEIMVLVNKFLTAGKVNRAYFTEFIIK